MKTQPLPLNETICMLTFHRLFEFSDYIVAIETSQLWLCLSLRCCNKLDIIWVPTLWFRFSFWNACPILCMETWRGDDWRLGQRFNTRCMQNSDIFTAGTRWFCCKRLHLSHITRVSPCPHFLFSPPIMFWFRCPQFDSFLSVEIESCQLDVSVVFQRFHRPGRRRREKLF